MTETLTKADKRNLRQTVGKAAAEAVDSVRNAVTRIELAHQVLARQMLEFETTASRLVESRAVDRKALEPLREQVESAHAKINTERTHVLKLAEEQRRYVDGAVRDEGRRAAGQLREMVMPRLERLEQLTLWQRLRWLFTGGLPQTPLPLTWPRAVMEALQPPVAQPETRKGVVGYIERDVYEAAWTDLGRPADADPVWRYATDEEARAAGQRMMAKHGPSLARLAPKPQHLGAVGGE